MLANTCVVQHLTSGSWLCLYIICIHNLYKKDVQATGFSPVSTMNHVLLLLLWTARVVGMRPSGFLL